MAFKNVLRFGLQLYYKKRLKLIHFFSYSASVAVKNMGNTATSINQAQFVEETIRNNCVTIFSKSYCPSCRIAKRNLDDHGITYKVVELDKREDGDEIMSVLHDMTQKRTVPRVFVNGNCIGGSEDTHQYLKNGKLFEMLDQCMKSQM